MIKKKSLRILLFILVGIIVGFPVFSMTYYTMVRTSTPEFCSICHEIVPAYEAWKTSTHVNNPRGIVADCMDCHLPAPHDTFDFFYAKTTHGLKDVISHFTGGAESYDRAEQRAAAVRSIKNAQCLKCHRNILYIPNNRGAMLAHKQVMYPRKGYEYHCLDCHSNLVHVDRPYYKYIQYSPPYVAPGL